MNISLYTVILNVLSTLKTQYLLWLLVIIKFLLSTSYLTDVLFVFLDLKYLPKVFFCSLTMFFCFCFQYVRECIALEKIPQFMLLTKESIYATLPECYFQMPSYSQRGNQPPPSSSLQYTFTYPNYWRL